jgi:serine/threonine-protein kinase
VNAIPPERWPVLDSLLDRLLERPREQWAGYLEEACGDDPVLLEHALRLLRALERPTPLLERPVQESAPDLLRALAEQGEERGGPEEADEPERDFPDGRVGPYRIVRELGRGGMGVVYLAERADGQYEGRVALKVVKRGLDTDEILRRFLRERQILAGLRHPHIARLFDGGLAPGGRPYLVMDHVEGLPLTRFCDERALSVDARLDLFEAVCEAVRHAHRNLVVHRDLKPSNILVDEQGHLTLLDFGIAKLLGGDEADAGGTRVGFHPMSPEYASPEQARGDPVTTTTDVYALGVVLYELLTGEKPHRFETVTPEAIARAHASPPAPPSEAVQRTGTRAPSLRSDDGGGSPPEPARLRSTTPSRLTRRLRGDLDTIVLTAMHADPERRYGSAEALLADLRRHRAGLPIAAHRDRALYRARKFVGRHRMGTAFAATLAGLALAFGGFHNARVSAERDAALREAAKAEQVTAFMVDMFRRSEPNAPDSLSLDDVLRIGAGRIQEELEDQPEVRAAMMSAMGGVYLNLGRYAEAGDLLEAALATRIRVLPPDDVVIGESLRELGIVLERQGVYDRADSALTAALGIFERRRGAEPEEIAAVLDGLFELRFAQGRYAEADSLERRALELRTASLEPTDPRIAHSHTNLGMVARRMDRPDVAELHQREALRLRRARFGDQHTLVALSLKDVALALHTQSRLEEAEGFYREALAIQEALYGEAHPELSTTLNSLASLLAARGELEEAKALHRRTLAMRRELFGDGHARVASSMVNLGTTLGDLGELPESIEMYEGALGIYRATFGPRHPSVATALNGLATTVADAGDPVRAVRLLEEAESIYVERLGPDHSWVAIVLLNHGDVRRAMGDHAASDSIYRRALVIHRATYEGPHRITARMLVGLGRSLLGEGRPDEAQEVLRDALRMSLEVLDEDHMEVRIAQAALGECLLVGGRPGEAEPLLKASLESLRRQPGPKASREAERITTLLAGG